MQIEKFDIATLYLGAMEDTIGSIQSVDHVLTDPPYGYIKTHAFDKPFNEILFFENTKRMLSDNGFITLFGRGTSFYRWNTRLADLGFVFKEDIVWDKRYTTAPCLALSRIHETVSIHTKKTGKIKRSKVAYIEQKRHDLPSIVNDIKRINSAINNEAGLNIINDFLQGGQLYQKERTNKHCISQQVEIKSPDRATATINSIANGMNERSIIILKNDHYKLQHPTEKPVRLAERILALISNEGDTIYDPFMGSGSFGVACINTGRKYIGSEIIPEYYQIAVKRIEEAINQNEKNR